MNHTHYFLRLLMAAVFTIIASATAFAQAADPQVADENPDGADASPCGCEIKCKVPPVSASVEVTAYQLSAIEAAAGQHRGLAISGGRFHLEWQQDDHVEFVLADSQGHQLRRLVNDDGVHSLDFETSSLPAGAYLLQLTTHDRLITVPLTIIH